MTSLAPRPDMSVETVTDPVCGRVLDLRQAAQIYDWRDQRYYFDQADCLRQFLTDPEKFMQISDTASAED